MKVGKNLPTKVQELESYTDCIFPDEVDIHPPKPSSTKGSGKRIKGGKEVAMEKQQKKPRFCKACGKYKYHDRRNCLGKYSP